MGNGSDITAATEHRPQILFVAQPQRATLAAAVHLAAQGWNTGVADDPAEALDRIEEWPPDIVVLPLHPPYLPLEECCALIRRCAWPRHVSVLVWDRPTRTAALAQFVYRCGGRDYLPYSTDAWDLALAIARELPRSTGPSYGDLFDAGLGQRLRAVPRPVLILHYDGTLVPFVSPPLRARPDQPLLELLRRLSAGSDVHLVSGRRRENLEAWFGDLPISLWSEHGAWRRKRDRTRWEATTECDSSWYPDVRHLMEVATAATPGSLVESKSTSLAWHFRAAEPEPSRVQAACLVAALRRHGAADGYDVVNGARMIEVRARGISPALIPQRLHADGVPPARVIAISDDTHGEGLFGSLPPEATTICVGRRRRTARYYAPDWRAVRAILDDLAARGQRGSLPAS